MGGLVINVAFEFIKEDPDCSECSVCKEVIVSDKNSMYLFLNNRLSSETPVLSICNSCYNAVEQWPAQT